jgi:hypothetical protein
MHDACVVLEQWLPIYRDLPYGLIIRWLSAGHVVPTADDFGMLRLALLTLLPQIGGLVLMVARR